MSRGDEGSETFCNAVPVCWLNALSRRSVREVMLEIADSERRSAMTVCNRFSSFWRLGERGERAHRSA
jgi:hypothetical protein